MVNAMGQPLVLVVDDSAEVAMILRAIGRRAGAEIAVARDVEQAWALVRQRRPDLILLDHHLPGPNGDVFCREVRAAADLVNLPVVLLGHWERPEDIAIGLEAGADGVLAKELLGWPELCQHRLQAFLACAAGRLPAHLLPCSKLDPSDRYDQLVRGAVRQVGPKILRLLAQRACRQAHARMPADVPADAYPSWLEADGLTLKQTSKTANPSALVALLAAMAEQLWCVLGNSAKDVPHDRPGTDKTTVSECASS